MLSSESRLSSSYGEMFRSRVDELDKLQIRIDEVLRIVLIFRGLRAHQAVAVATLSNEHCIELRRFAVKHGDLRRSRHDPNDVSIGQIGEPVRHRHAAH